MRSNLEINKCTLYNLIGVWFSDIVSLKKCENEIWSIFEELLPLFQFKASIDNDYVIMRDFNNSNITIFW